MRRSVTNDFEINFDISSYLMMYRVANKGWDCKNDKKLFKYDVSQVGLIKYSSVSLIFNGLSNDWTN